MDQLLEEASLWFARMRGPDAETYRPEFEKWLSMGAAHLGAYNRAGEIFAIGRFLAHEKSTAPASTPYAPETPWRIYTISAALVFTLGVAGWVGFSRPSPDRAAQTLMSKVAVSDSRSYSTVGANGRSVKLPDGSVVALEADTILNTQYGADRRELRLERGSARFDVAHERRPFTVSAGGGRVTARGTLFDVSLTSPGRVVVRLLRGAIDVERPVRSISAGEPIHSTVTRLSIGDELSFALPVQRLGATEAGSGIPTTDKQPEFSLVREFDGAALSAVVSETNRDSLTAIRLADPSIGNLKVSGRFRVDSPEQVAGRLASLFDLEAKREAPHMIVLRRR
ncbi:MAG TPA: FecR domain-containing protein [Novosphingobium sp.]|nr:FecR domain-containing protein [Novosphingobium sp.]